MTEQLRRLGVDDLAINYLYWGKDGTGSAVPDGIDPEGRLGGKKAFREMLEALDTEETALYLDVNLTDMVKSRWGYHTGFDSAASIQKSPAVQYVYYINTLKARKSDPIFLLRSDKFQKAASGILADAENYSFTGFSAHTLGQKLYSDFRGQERRDTAEKTWQNVLEMLRQAKGRQMLSAPNAYAAPYADIITDVPLYSSSFFLETRTVPFYTIALHGHVLLSTPDLNRMSDPTEGLLAALENGKVAAYVVDFPTDDMLGVENVIAIPHLGASTPESEDNCAMMAAAELIDYLENGNIRNSVNFPAMDVARSTETRICVLHRNIPNMLAQISGVVSAEGINIETMVNRSKKDNAYTILDVVGDVSDDCLAKIQAIDGVIRLRKIQ